VVTAVPRVSWTENHPANDGSKSMCCQRDLVVEEDNIECQEALDALKFAESDLVSSEN
jgi:hypothetical protein